MLKTNSKQVREFFKTYVQTALYEYDGGIPGLIKNFNNYYYDNEVSNLAYFMVNIDCSLDFYYDDQRQMIKAALQETEEEANKYDDTQVSNLFLTLCERALNESINYDYNYYRLGNSNRYFVQIKEA